MTDRIRTPLRGVPIRRAATEGRARRPSEEHGWSHFEQTVLRSLEKLDDGIVDLGVRVTKIEDHRLTEAGARSVRETIWRWVLGILAALVIAGVVALARGLGR